MNKKDLLVKIHGYVASDGGIYFKKCKDIHGKKLRIRKRLRTYFYNTEEVLIKDFIKALKKLYPKIKSIKYRPKRYEVRVENHRISKDILKLGKIGSKVWEFPSGLNKRQKIIWIRAFVDGEGSVCNSDYHRYIVIDSINGLGLKKVAFNLKSLGIENHFYKFNFKGYIFYRIKISRKINLIKFYNVIGFNHPKRMRRLKEAINSYKYNI
ncbi:MAG: LAGLIDADG family homing endonuclease [Nanoarchaeota archaeon]